MAQTQKRIDALDAEIAGIEAEIADLTVQHAKQVQAGDDAQADDTMAQIKTARERMGTAEMRRAPLMRVLQAELDAAQAKVAEKLTSDADGMQTA